MLDFFEVKTYRQLEFVIGGANVVLLSACLVIGYFVVLAATDRVRVDDVLSRISSSKIVALLPVAVISIVWAWSATQILRLHDRVHEPILRKWRAGYDSDFVLRSLLSSYTDRVPPELYERAYADARLRNKFMGRLFYAFVGDEAKNAEGQRLFIYGELTKYWCLGLVEIYAGLALLVFASYTWRAGSPLSPLLVIALVLIGTAARIYSNSVLDAVHSITIEQVAEIRNNHSADLEKALSDVLKDQGMIPRK